MNTLQGLEDLPFDEGVQKGARLFGCHPYLTEERYREKMARGRIRVEDLLAVLREDLAGRANELVSTLGSRLELRQAMLQHPLRFGPAEELRWFVAEMDALTRLRDEMPPQIRKNFIEETRHWAMRFLRGTRKHGRNESRTQREPHSSNRFADVMRRFGESSIEQWSERTWESFALQALWRICHSGVQGLEASQPWAASPEAIRHRDILQSPVRESLIHKRRAKANQHFMH